MHRAIGLIVLFLAAGCTQMQSTADDIARGSAKKAVTEVVATRLPGVPQKMISPFTDCVIDNASAGEISRLAKDAVVLVDQGTFNVVQRIISRPETTQCLAKNSLNMLSGATG